MPLLDLNRFLRRLVKYFVLLYDPLLGKFHLSHSIAYLYEYDVLTSAAFWFLSISMKRYFSKFSGGINNAKSGELMVGGNHERSEPLKDTTGSQ